MGPPDSHGVPRAPRYSGCRYASPSCGYRTITVCGVTFQTLPLVWILQRRGPTTPVEPESHWFGLFPGRSPLLGESLLFSLPAGTKMFQFPAFASTTKGGYLPFRQVGCPIRESRDQWSLAPAPGLSQLITPFIACESLGIRRTPLLPFSHTDPPGTPEGQSILSDGPAPQKLRRGVRLSSTSCPTCQRTIPDEKST